MLGQTSYKITLSLESSLISGNPANYSYNIIFSNNTAINGSINSSNVSYSKVFTLHSNETAKIIFDVSGNANYTAEDPGALVIPAQIEYYVPITLSNSQTAPTPSPFQEMLSVNSLSYNSYETNSLNNIEFFLCGRQCHTKLDGRQCKQHSIKHSCEFAKLVHIHKHHLLA